MNKEACPPERRDKMSTANGKNNNGDFLDDVLREAGYRRCVILTGNVRDQFNDGQNHYLPLSEVILARLGDMKRQDQPWFTICAIWDPVNSMTFSKPMMQQNFQRALNPSSSATSSDTAGPSCSSQAYDDDSADTPPTGNNSSANNILRPPAEPFGRNTW